MNKNAIDLTLEEIRAALEAEQFDIAIQAFHRLRPADRAEAFADLGDKMQQVLLPELDIETTADLLEELEDMAAADVAGNLTTERLADVLDEMEPDDAADVLGDLTPERAAEALAEMEDAEEVIPLLEHEDETAGGLMTTSFITLSPDNTAGQAVQILRRIKPDTEIPYYLYVVDTDYRLIGIVGLRELVIASPADIIRRIMDPEVVYVTTAMDQEDAANVMARYDLAALPVLNEEGRLQGVITHDDLYNVLEEEATEDIYRLANVADGDLTIHSPISLEVRRRLPWLFLNTLTALFAAWVISHYETLIAQVAILAVFQSVVAGMGGNAGTQSLAMVVRAIALGDIPPNKAYRTVLKEGGTGIIQGVCVGISVGLGVYLWKGNLFLGLVLCLALIGNMFIAVIVGTIVPLVLKAVKQDPALASSVLVTAVTDSVGFFLFLSLATLFQGHL
ncbi:MAG: magnesium transporter [Anaerolineales bacterium]|nr:magnesium transporter [Anaerolineales bacterium]